ncbi:MAG: OmpA family protein [Geobacter sp.]|nr:MAG: OmpA family protein [Geobacter sp.]
MNPVTRVLVPSVLMALPLVCSTKGMAAEKYDGFTMTPVAGIFSPGGFSSLKTGLMAGVKIDKRLTEALGIEGDISVARADGKSSGSTTLYMFSLQTVYPFLESPKLTPFLTFGAGGLIADQGSSSPLVNFGLGAKYFIKNDLAFRCDVRDVAASSQGNSFELTAGVSFVFDGQDKQHRRRIHHQPATAATDPPVTAPPTNPTASVTDTPPATVQKNASTVTTPAVAPALRPVSAPASQPVAAPTAPAPAPEPQPPVTAAVQPPTPPQFAGATETAAPEKQKQPDAEKPVVPLMKATFEFDQNSSKIKPRFIDAGRKIGLFMKRNPDTIAQIYGHADSTGTSAHNIELSGQRAARIKQYLMKMYDLPAERFQIHAVGSAEPVVDNTTETGRQRNRRALIIVLK